MEKILLFSNVLNPIIKILKILIGINLAIKRYIYRTLLRIWYVPKHPL